MNKSIILAFILFNFFSLLSQEIVVSEYFNKTTSPNGEWTELLVIADNLNITNYALRDNSWSSSLTSWQGGVKFKNEQIWQNLRAGTIIVLNHRGSDIIDDDGSDGYIEIGAENTTYFEKVVFCEGCTINNWIIVALSISQDGEIIQIINADGEHVHCLAHFPNEMGEWLNLPNSKIARQGAISGNTSLCVVPAVNLSAYSIGVSNEQTSYSDQFITKGKPNNSSTSTDENQIFWRELRQPVWNSPTLSVAVAAHSVMLNWNSAIDNNPNDNIQGYLITRCPTEDIATALTPEDGKIYQTGDLLGSAVVLIHTNELTYTDYFSINCGESFTYRIFTYRYSADNLGEDALPTYARGRAYNEPNFAENIGIKRIPATPTILVEDNKTRFCEGDSCIVSVSNQPDIQKYELYFNGNLIDSSYENKFVIKDSGYYSINVINSFNCGTFSNEILIEVIKYPIAEIQVNSNLIIENKTYKICEGETIELTASGGNSYEWFRNNISINTNQPNVLISDVGEYFCIVSNENLCSDTTFSVDIKYKKENFSLNPKNIKFELANEEIVQKKSFSIKNEATDTLFLPILKAPSLPFKLNSDLLLEILPFKNIDLEISFETEFSGYYNDFIVFQSECGKRDTLFLNGVKNGEGLIASSNKLDFDLLLICDTSGVIKEFTIINPSFENATISKFKITQPFELLEPVIPTEIKSNDSINFKVKLTPQSEGVLKEKIVLYYSVGIIEDSIAIDLIGQVAEPKFSIFPDSLVIPTILEGVNFFDTTFIIKNTSNIAIEVNLETNNPELVFSDFPIILDPDEQKEINLRITPGELGEFEFTSVFKETLCKNVNQLIISGKKEKAEFYFSVVPLNFGTYVRCNENVSVRKNVVLYKISTSSNLKISKYEISDGFLFLNEINEKLSDSTTLEIEFNPNTDKEYIGYLTLYFEPTNQTIELVLKGEQNSISLDYEKVLDFGFITSKDSSVLEYSLINTSKFPLEINDYSISNSAFTLTNDTIFPFTLGVDSLIVLNFEYRNDKDSKDTAEFKLNIESPCNTYITSTFFGRCVHIKPFVFEVKLPDTSSIPNLDFGIPISIISKDTSRRLSDAYINGFSCDIEYDPTLLYPIEAAFSENNFINGVIDEFYETSPGILKIKAEISESKLILDGEIIVVKFKTLVGNKYNCDLILRNSELTSNLNINTENKDGTYELINDYLSTSGDSIKLEILGEQPITSEVQILCNIVTEEKSTLKIFNQLGQEAEILLNQNIAPGKYYFRLNPNAFVTGIYFVVLNNGNLIKRISILIVK